MDRRKFLKTAALSVSALVLPGCTNLNEAKKTPNIILIFADDLGYADVGYHGCPDIATPNIDSIAKNGASFSAAYVTAPVCGPSRAGLLTGRYQQRFGFEDNPGPLCKTPDTKIGIPDSEAIIAERLKAYGYKSAFIGKHHSGKENENNPVHRGFDFFFGFDDGASTYFIGENEKGILKRGLKSAGQEDEYLTDAFGRETVSFIKQNKDNPFFIYLSFNAVHAPMEAPDFLLKKYAHIKNPVRRSLAAMLHSLDENVGKILNTLKSCGIEENTLIIFTSDNGGAGERSNYSNNTPLRDLKTSMYEGGLRVPFCIQWKNRIPADQSFDLPISSLDILPTIINACGGKVDKSWNLDGRNLLPVLENKNIDFPERCLYWRFLHGWAIRDNTWKLVKPWGGSNWDTNQKTELYHIALDIGEQNNVIDQYPEEAQRLQKVWDKWSSTLKEPQWGWQEMCGPYRVPL